MFDRPAMKDRLICAPRDFEDQSLLGSFAGKVLLDPLPQLGRVDPDYIVLASVIGGRPAKYLGADLLLVDLRAARLQRLVAHVQQKIAQPGRSPELCTGCYAPDQSTPLVDASIDPSPLLAGRLQWNP